MEDWEKNYIDQIVGDATPSNTDANSDWLSHQKQQVDQRRSERPWYKPVADMANRIGFESAGAAAGWRGGTELMKNVPTVPGRFDLIPKIVVPAISAGIGGVIGKHGSELTGVTLPGDESPMSDIYTGLGGTIGPSAPSAGGSAIRSVFGPNRATRRAVEEASKLGIRYTPGTVSDRQLVRALEQRLREFPITSSNVDIALEQMYKEFQDAAKHLSDDATLDLTTDAFEVGSRIQASAATKAERYGERAEHLFDLVKSFGLSPNQPVELNRTARFLQTYAGQYGDEYQQLADAFGDSFLESLKKRLVDADGNSINELPWGVIDQVRKQVGFKTRASRTDKFDPTLAKRLYAAILDDMGDAATLVNNDVNNAWRNARRYWNMMGKSIDQTFDQVNKLDPDKLFNLLEKGNITKIAQAKKASDPETWKYVQAAMVRRLGQVSAANQDVGGQVFSPKVFLTNFNKLSQNSKKPMQLLFKEAGQYEGIYDDLVDLAKVADRMSRPGSYANPSGTSNALAILGILGGAVYDPLGVGAAVGATKLGAKVWTNQNFLEWLLEGKNISRGKRDFVNWISSMPVFYGTEQLSGQDEEILKSLQNRLMDLAEIPTVPTQ